MSAKPNHSSQDILKNFIPLNTLPSARFTEICNDCPIEECAKGTVLFEQGDDAKEFIYLVSGMISLYAGDMEMETVVTGSEAARFAIAHHIPRKVKAVTKSKARIVRIPTYKLDVERQEDTSQTYMVDEVEDQGGDWMTTMLQSPVFQRLPASNLQKIMMQMEEVAFEAGEIVVNQGDEADFYYIIKSGDCELIRQPTEGARPVKLAELHSCEAFGEDALLSGNPRNVTVRMKGKGQMLRLSKANFISLVKEPVLQYVSFEEGQKKVNGGANWLDVRVVESYEEGCIDGSVNIPFFSLRMKVSELKHDQLQVLVCEKGRTSEATAFLLLKFGFNALILKGGMEGLQKAAKPMPTKPIPEDITKPEVAVAKKHLSSTGGVDETKNEQLLTTAQNKIFELEKLCAQSNEKLNTLELERNNLQQQHDQQAQLVAELQVSSQTHTEQLKESNANNERRGAELVAALSVEKGSNAALVAELEKNQTELNRVAEEAAGSGSELAIAQQALSEKNTEATAKDEALTAKQLELEQLKNKLDNANSQESELSQNYEQQLAKANQKITDLTDQKTAIDKSIDDLRSNANEAEQLNVNLQRKVELLEQDSSTGLLKKDEQIDALNAQLLDMRNNVVGTEAAKEEADSLLHEALGELEKIRSQGEQALTEYKTQAVFEQEKLESTLAALKQQVDEKENDLSTMTQSVKRLEEQLNSLDDAGRNSDAELQKKSAEIESFKTQLNEAELKVQQGRSDLAASASDNEQLTLSLTEQSLIEKAENKDLEEKLNQASQKLTSLLLEHDTLKSQLETTEQGAAALREKAQSNLTAVANQKEINDQLQKDLEASKAQIDVSVIDTAKLETELSAAHQQAERAEASLSAVTTGKETVEGELTERLAQMEINLANASEVKNSVEQQFKQATDENTQLQEQLTALKKQSSNETDEHQTLQEEFRRAREEIVLAVENKEVEELKLLESSQQVAALEDKLKLMQTQLSDVSEKLATVSDDNGSLKQKASDAEAVLSASTGDQQALLTQLDDALKEVVEYKEAASANKLTAGEIEISKAALEQALNESHEALQTAQTKTNDAEGEVKELTDRLSVLSSARGSEEGALKQQLINAENKLKESDQKRDVLEADLMKLDEKLSAASSSSEKTAFELSELRESSVSGDEGLKQAHQKIDELTRALKAESEEKERSIADSNQNNEGKLSLLTDELSVAKDEAKYLLVKVEELSSLQNEGKKESGDLADQLQAVKMEKDDLRRRVGELERSAVDVDEAPSEEERNELKAVKSELNLVREQTESDIKAMQVKLENSEKMNLALKKKILSMQALANQEQESNELEPEKEKKGWWKK
ncbi:MAG: cyclic nucleotide-binding domain-containing protein [Cycloclasticus sp.]